MATAMLGATYSPPSPLGLHYTDNTSSIHPDRPIRPLPKRRLRSRLPSDVADSILYTPDTSASSAYPNVPYNAPSTFGSKVLRESPNSDARYNSEAVLESYSYQFRGNDFVSDEENVAMRRYQEPSPRRYSTETATTRNGHYSVRNEGPNYAKAPLSKSVAAPSDCVDGYDSFENTNNKKKRKIPTSSSLNSHQPSLSADMGQMGLSGTRDIDISQVEVDGGVGHYYGSGSSAIPAVSSGNGISGAGRGRFGRAGIRYHSGRSPLGVSINGSNSLQANRSPYYRRDYNSNGSTGFKDLPGQTSEQGIISAAIANAAALPITPTRGQENTSLFEQHSSKTNSSTKTLFTFTCESDSAKSMVWPDIHSPVSPWRKGAGHDPRARMSQDGRNCTTPCTQTSPNMVGETRGAISQQSTAKQQAPQQRKPLRRTLSSQYRLAARDRKMRQEYSNYHHPPKDEDTWICQFCEYESIFGQKPKGLIKIYEARDRRERKRLAEKRRLLEKAKMKGRKGKKGNKTNKNAATAAQPLHQNAKHRHEDQSVDEVPLQHQHRGVKSDEYFLDDYDEDPIALPKLQDTPSKIPQPTTHDQYHSRRPPNGTSALRHGVGVGQETY